MKTQLQMIADFFLSLENYIEEWWKVNNGQCDIICWISDIYWWVYR